MSDPRTRGAAAALPRLVIAGVSSGTGKTTLAVGLTRALSRRGLSVQAFKCGPDYLDPTYLTRATDTPAHNLDGWMMGREAVLDTFARAAARADISIIEGVMGLFDGAGGGEQGSTAEIAKWLAAPVVLVADATGMSRSIAALAKGFSEFDPALSVKGLVCNRVGSARHLALLQKSLEQPPLLGGLTRQAQRAFPERHLGLCSADEHTLSDVVLEGWAEQVSAELDVSRILALARAAPALAVDIVGPAPTALGRCRIGVAFDAAFHFYYADNLQRLERLGAELVRFSPLEGRALPEVDGLYIGGGYPELHAERLARDTAMSRSIRDLARAGAPIYAECGGFMYLAESLTTSAGSRFPMLGLLSGHVHMRERLVALGYVEAETLVASVLGAAGLRFRGHQFRYSELGDVGVGAPLAYRLQRPDGSQLPSEGQARGNVLGSYVHAHWASNPALATNFVDACARWRGAQLGASTVSNASSTT